MPMCPVPGSTGSAPLHCGHYRLSLGYPSLLPTDSRHLAWQFSDPLSAHQNKVRHVTKESQGMISRGASHPCSRGESGDFVCFWRLRIFPTAPRMSAVGGYTCTYACRSRLATHSGLQATRIFGNVGLKSSTFFQT